MLARGMLETSRTLLTVLAGMAYTPQYQESSMQSVNQFPCTSLALAPPTHPHKGK